MRPRIVLALGAMAAQTLFGNAFRLTTERGQWRALDDRTTALASWHPSAILRMREPERTGTRALLREDLAQVATALDNLR